MLEEIHRKLDELKSLRDQAAKRGICTAREEVTITTAELFLDWIAWDQANPDRLVEVVAEWYKTRDRAAEIAAAIPQQEIEDTEAILDAAISELKDVLAAPDRRRPVPSVDPGSLSIHDGYARQNGRPVFLSGFIWMPTSERLSRAYGIIDNLSINHGMLQSKTEGVPDETILALQHGADRMVNTGTRGYTFLGHHLPEWALAEYPNIEDGSRLFTRYDIDHPGTREMWRRLLADVAPPLKDHPGLPLGYLLANEPHWFTAEAKWATGSVSDYTFAGFRRWLAERHIQIARLNELWESEFRSFDDVRIDLPIAQKLRGTPIWYDWCRFNMDRVTEWFTFLRDEIRARNPEAPCHIKLVAGHVSGESRDHGIDSESLVELQDIVGCDAEIEPPSPYVNESATWPDRYALDWQKQSMAYDFYKSVAPSKLIFDSEWHGLSAVHWRKLDMSPEYVRCALWLAHLHGMGANETWFWSRKADGSPVERCITDWVGGNLMLPKVQDAFGRTFKELNAFADEVVHLATAAKEVRLLYAEEDLIQSAEGVGRLKRVYRTLYHLGHPLGFVTGRMLRRADEDLGKVLVVAGINRVRTDTLRHLNAFCAKGSSLAVISAESLRQDEYGRQHPEHLLPDPDRTLRGTLELLDDESAMARLLSEAGIASAIACVEEAGPRTCVWRSREWENGRLLFVGNLGKDTQQVTIRSTDSNTVAITNLFSGEPVQSPTMVLHPYDIALLHVRAQ